MNKTELNYKLIAVNEKRKLFKTVVYESTYDIERILEKIIENKEPEKTSQYLQDIQEDCSAMLGVLDEY